MEIEFSMKFNFLSSVIRFLEFKVFSFAFPVAGKNFEIASIFRL